MLPMQAVFSVAPIANDSIRGRPFPVSPPPSVALALAGEFDCSNCADLVARVDTLCRQRGRRIRIDLGAVTFIDAAAVGAFLRARHRARTLGCEVVLGSVHGLPLRVLQILGVDTLLIEHEGLHE